MPVLHPKHQIPLEWLAQNGRGVFFKYEPWLNKYHGQIITSAELTAIFLILFVKDLKKDLWYGGKSNIVGVDGVDPGVQRERVEEWVGERVDAVDPYGHLTIHEFFNFHNLRGIPLKAHRALLFWLNHKYPMVLEFDVPSPYELLSLQTQGKRVVWLPQHPDDFTRYHHGKDPLNFVIHDLKHADEFFFEQDRCQAQIKFYQEVFAKYKDGYFDEFLKNDPQFKEEFEYVISDMNSHPEHLKVTLEAILKHSQTRINKLSA